MKVLQICSKPPFPATDGGCKAMNNITEGLLLNNIEVKVLTIATEKHPFKETELPKEYKNNTNIEAFFIDTKVKVLGAIWNLFSLKSYNVSRFYSSNFENLIGNNLEEQDYDIILLEGLFVMPYLSAIRKKTTAKIIYRAHNIEFEIWERNAISETNPIKKWYLSLLARKLKIYEVSILNKIDGIASITDRDKQELIALGCKKVIETIPFGIDIRGYFSGNRNEENSLFYIGSMDWIPNQEAIKWFLDKVLPKVEDPFYLAGKNMPNWLLTKKQEGLTVVGEVKSAIDFINKHKIMVVPLFSGSGMRIKIIEAMALGKVVIATDIALEGINCKHKESVLIANTIQEFIDEIKWCSNNVEIIDNIGRNARNAIVTNYDNKVIVNNLVQFFKQQVG